jgi:hypothetical protein
MSGIITPPDYNLDPADDGRVARSWWKNNWMAFIMFLAVILTQIWNGTNWLHARESDQVVTRAELLRLEQEIQAVPNTYVRQDVFTQVLININQHLSSIDSKLERK